MESHFATVAEHTVIELDSLLRDYLLGLVLIAGIGQDTGARPVQWVHSSDLEDPTPFLTPRTVLLTTGAQFTPGAQFGEEIDDEAIGDYVHRLVAAGTTALGIAVGVRWERIPPPLIEACDRMHLPLFRVPYDTPFIAVVRTAARLLEAQAHEGGNWDREHGSLTNLAKRRQDLAASERALRRAVLQLLVDGRRELAEDVAGELLPELPRGQQLVCAWRDAPAPLLTEIGPLLTEQDGVLSADLGERTVIVCESSRFAAIRRALARHSAVAGVSERGAQADLAEMIEQAERADDLARRQGGAGPLDYRPSMHAGLMQVLQASPEAARRASGLLAPLRRHDERHDDRLERSLEAWLRHHGQTSPAAAELGLHRHTLRARVQTAAELLQRDLDDPDARAELWAALRLTPRSGAEES